MISLITPNWPAPTNIQACSTTRTGGVSLAPYHSFNLGDHVNDQPEHVEANRRLLQQSAGLPQQSNWLQQVHGTDVAILNGRPLANRCADAVYSQQTDQVCAIMTADCLPVLFCSTHGDEVAAAHAGWRGLCDGVLEQTLKQFKTGSEHVLAWLGPAIGPDQFEVGAEVRQAFLANDPQADKAFVARGKEKYLADIYLLAKQRLISAGVSPANIYGGDFCTVTESERFFSYRRDGITGRMASLIWIAQSANGN